MNFNLNPIKKHYYRLNEVSKCQTHFLLPKHWHVSLYFCISKTWVSLHQEIDELSKLSNSISITKRWHVSLNSCISKTWESLHQGIEEVVKVVKLIFCYQNRVCTRACTIWRGVIFVSSCAKQSPTKLFCLRVLL